MQKRDNKLDFELIYKYDIFFYQSLKVINNIYFNVDYLTSKLYSFLWNYFLLKIYTKKILKKSIKTKTKFFQMSSYLEKTIKFSKYHKKGISDSHRKVIRKIA